jgi:hypothetical protein
MDVGHLRRQTDAGSSSRWAASDHERFDELPAGTAGTIAPVHGVEVRIERHCSIEGLSFWKDCLSELVRRVSVAAD